MMKTFIHLIAGRASILASILVLNAWMPEAHAQNVVLNGSFESGNWSGTQAFVEPNNASTLLYWNNVVSKWTPNSGSTWVQDSLRASDGNRMVWLGPPTSSSETYISQPVSTLSAGGSLQSNTAYRLTLDYDFFDLTDPSAGMAMDSTINVYYVLGTYMFMGDPEMPMLMDDSFTKTSLYSDTGTIDSWLNGANMNWTTASIDFQTPNLTGYDYLRVFISAPQNSVPTPSMGVLVDNVSLSAAPVPEPGSALLLSLGALLVRRRRSI